MGFKRSQARMREIEAKLRAGMTQNGISPKAQEEIILSITSFALYGFPESHAASFALIAYASAYLKCHYLAAFTAALLNNQPMGFYSPATIVTDAKRHGLKMLPVDVTCSEWMCTLETVASTQLPVAGKIGLTDNLAKSLRRNIERDVGQNIEMDTGKNIEKGTTSVVPSMGLEHRALAPEVCSFQRETICETSPQPIGNQQPETGNSSPVLRLGLRYVRGLREEAAQALVRERSRAPFTSIHDLTRRVPELRKDELTTLAKIGALNKVASTQYLVPGKTSEQKMKKPRYQVLDTRYSPLHRRDALWHVESAVRASGPLLENLPEHDSPSPLQPMNHEERLIADFHGTGMTVGPHPMAYRREWLNAMGIRRAIELRDLPSGKRLRIGGCVIVRQRPGTAKGFVFLSIEDETGVANAIIAPDLFHSNRLLLASEKFLAIEGILQNQDNVISVKAERVLPLFVTKAETVSHDFH
jgi:error-prone DNA polymerase